MVNKISREDFKVVIASLKAAYPTDKFIDSEHTFNLWYTTLQDIDYPTLNKAAMSYIMSNHYPPTISDIRQYAYDLSAPADDIAAEEWSNLMKALGHSGSPEAIDYWDRLPEITRKIVGSFREFQEWGNTETCNLMSVQRPMFIKRFEEMSRAERLRGAVPVNLTPPTKQLTAETVARLEEKTASVTGDRATDPHKHVEELRRRLNKCGKEY